MSRNGRNEPSAVTDQFNVNLNKIPAEEIWKHIGKHVAYSMDGKAIVASADTMEDLYRSVNAAGLDSSQVVWDYVDDPEIGWF